MTGLQWEYEQTAQAVLAKRHRSLQIFARPTEKVARQLNERPRKTFAYETPAEKFQVCVAANSRTHIQKWTLLQLNFCKILEQPIWCSLGYNDVFVASKDNETAVLVRCSYIA